MRLRPGAVPAPGQGAALDPLAVVRAAMAGDPVATEQPKRRLASGEFSMTTVSPALRKLAVLYAVYLGFSSLRIQEIITPLAIPKLPMIMSLGIAAWLIASVPRHGWVMLWRASLALSLQSVITFFAILTVPLGIWMSYSLELLYPGYLLSVLVFVAGVVLLRDRLVLARVLQIVVGTLALIATLVFLGIGAGAVGDEGRLTVGASIDPNDYAWILVTFIPLALWLGVRKKTTAVFWFGVAALFLLSIVPTQSRGGFVALIASTTVLILFGTAGWRRVATFIGLAILGAAFVSYMDAVGATRLIDFSGYEGGTGRMDYWKQGLRWMVQRPWGFGMGNYATYNIWMTRSYHGAHSAYINLAVELGVIAGVAFVALWLSVLRGVRRVRVIATALTGNPVAQSEATMSGFILASMVGNVVGSMFLNTQYAAMTLFIQALGAAVILGSPFRTANIQESATLDRSAADAAHRRVTRGRAPGRAISLSVRTVPTSPPRPGRPTRTSWEQRNST